MGGYRVDVAGVGYFIPEWTVYTVTLLSRLVRQPMGAIRDTGNSGRGDVAAAIRLQRLARDRELKRGHELKSRGEKLRSSTFHSS
jgi:hypothetical protein